MWFMSWKHLSAPALRVAAALLFAMLVGTSFANAQIVSLSENQNSCAPAGPMCITGSTPYSLIDILNGSEVLDIPDTSSTPSWYVQNDTGGAVTSLSLIFDGDLASNANLNCNFGGGVSGTCTVDGGANGISNPIPAGDLPATIEFSGINIASGADFEINTASFAHAGQDFGCLAGVGIAPSSGTSCTPASVPEPNALTLLLAWLVVGGTGIGFRRRFRFARKPV